MRSTFPHVTSAEFEEACTSLAQTFQQRSDLTQDWVSVDKLTQNETTFLRISKLLSSGAERFTDDENNLDCNEVTEDDEEVLVKSTPPPPTIRYDILLSPTYSVPVLYISMRDTQHRYPPSMETLYQHIVPPQFKAQTEGVGVMGGITITDHPATGRPVFFIHPCRTAEVMEASIERGKERQMTGEEYLMVWMGALGRSVGLDVPLALAAQQHQS
jgi:ubiquitin-like-conjugating enzyme ATG10